MDWNYIERELKVTKEWAGEDADEILASLARLESEFGLQWIEGVQYIRGIAGVGRLVNFEKCLRVTGVIDNGHVLKRKLIENFSSGGLRDAEAEAHVAIRLVSSGSKITYEPQLYGKSRKVDFIADWGDKKAAFEVTKLERSAQNVEQAKWQKDMAEACADILQGGSLDIYIMEEEITQNMQDRIVSEVKKLTSIKGNTDYLERSVSETIYLAYDPTGSVRKDRSKAPLPSKTAYKGLIFCNENDRSFFIKEKLGSISPMSGLSHINIPTLQDDSKVSVLVRINQISVDSRGMTKAIQKSVQLPHDMTGIVVIDMSWLSQRPNDWASEIYRMFGQGLYSKISAVWLRSGYMGKARIEWTEYILPNPYASVGLEKEIAQLILPSGREVTLDADPA